ncbi:MAG: hypothetical protein GX230_01905 [Lentisphaerae bacterium]|mgnify:CR=1 FL=1|nr:hypothetical protein [Lentisphaerota bacterium]
MERLWQFLMRANARALFIIALIVLLVVVGWRGWVEVTATTEPLPEEQVTGRMEFKQGKPLGLMEFAASQVAWAGALPICPFLPTLEAMATDPKVAEAMLGRGGRQGWRAFEGGDGGSGSDGAGGVTDPFKHLRGDRKLPRNAEGENGAAPGMVRLTFKGFFKGPDGNSAALFHDSASGSFDFKLAGADMYGAKLIDADINSARIDLHGDEIELRRNESFDVKPK